MFNEQWCGSGSVMIWIITCLLWFKNVLMMKVICTVGCDLIWIRRFHLLFEFWKCVTSASYVDIPSSVAWIRIVFAWTPQPFFVAAESTVPFTVCTQYFGVAKNSPKILLKIVAQNILTFVRPSAKLWGFN